MNNDVLDKITVELHRRQSEEEQAARDAPTVGLLRNHQTKASVFGEAITILEKVVNENA